MLLPLLGLLHAAGALPLLASAQELPRLVPLRAEERPWLLPGEPLHRPYLADPRRTTFSITQQNYADASIDETGDQRTGIQMGSRFGIFTWGDGEWGIDGEVGFLGQFDQDRSTDNVGWDGIYGFDVVWRPADRFGLRFGLGHDSAHVGDELIEETGRTRIDYTREELRLGASLDLSPVWRSYAEFGWAFKLRNPGLMEKGRLQLGLEYDSAPSQRDTFEPFLAMDVSSFQEDDWEPNLGLQLGWVRRSSGGGVLRTGLEVVSGRSPMGEFFQDRETYLALGIWVDP